MANNFASEILKRIVMTEKSLILSASGLKNIILASSNDNIKAEEFLFIFGSRKFKTKTFFAEFISPRVSRLHQADPTINSIDFTQYFSQPASEITTLLIDNIDQLSRGNSIQIDEEMGNELRYISTLLENEEICNLVDDLFPISDEEKRINDYLHLFQSGVKETVNSEILNFHTQSMINLISSHFFSIDEGKLLSLPIPILYLIVTNENLKLNSENQLFEFINKLFESNEDKQKIDFYEAIEFASLTQNKLNEFLYSFESENMTKPLWSKLVKCFYSNKEIVKEIEPIKNRMENCKNRYFQPNDTENTIIEYDNDKNNRFNGIFTKLGGGDSRNVYRKNIVSIASSSSLEDRYRKMKSVFNFENDKKIFHSNNEPNSWLKFDFINRKIKVSAYSIMSHGYENKKNNRLKNWCIEGSNDEIEWNLIDERKNVESVADKSAEYTFFVNQNDEENNFFRFIRIRQTDVNNSNNYRMVFAAIEFFGSIKEQQ